MDLGSCEGMIQKMIDAIGVSFPLTELDCGEYAKQKVSSMQYLEAFLATSQNAAPCEAEPKRGKASVYVEGLLTHGGPSTNVFKKSIGEEKTAELFRKTLFATQV